MMLKDHKQLPQAKGVWVFAHKYVQYLCTHVYVMIVIPLQLLHIHNYVSYILRSKDPSTCVTRSS